MVTAMPSDGRMLLTVEDAAAKLSLHRSRIFPLLKQGKIASLRIGKSRRISIYALEEFIRREEQSQRGELPPLE